MTSKPPDKPPSGSDAPAAATADNPAPALSATILPAPSAAPMPPLFGAGPVPAAKAIAPEFLARKAAPEPPIFPGPVAAAAPQPPAFAAPEPPDFDVALSIGQRIATYAGTTWATFVSSIIVPALAGVGIFVVGFAVLGAAIAGGDLISAVTSLSLKPVMQGPAWQMLAIAAAAGALFVSVWGLKDYLLGGRQYLLGRLTKNIPKDEATLEQTPARYVRFYHGVLKWCGAFAFLCEVAFQLVAFAIFTWGIATGFPGFGLFNNPDQLSIANTFFFWVEDAFAIVDGPHTLGITLSTLEPNKAAWVFGLVTIFFKIGVVGLILQLVRTSFTLRPADISLAWQKAYERQD